MVGVVVGVDVDVVVGVDVGVGVVVGGVVEMTDVLAAPCLFFLVALLSAHPKYAVLAMLYLPQAKTQDVSDFTAFREWAEFKYPGKTIALINDGEQLMMKRKGSEWTPVLIDDLRVYLIPKQRNMRLVKGAA